MPEVDEDLLKVWHKEATPWEAYSPVLAACRVGAQPHTWQELSSSLIKSLLEDSMRGAADPQWQLLLQHMLTGWQTQTAALLDLQEGRRSYRSGCGCVLMAIQHRRQTSLSRHMACL